MNLTIKHFLPILLNWNMNLPGHKCQYFKICYILDSDTFTAKGFVQDQAFGAKTFLGSFFVFSRYLIKQTKMQLKQTDCRKQHFYWVHHFLSSSWVLVCFCHVMKQRKLQFEWTDHRNYWLFYWTHHLSMLWAGFGYFWEINFSEIRHWKNSFWISYKNLCSYQYKRCTMANYG